MSDKTFFSYLNTKDPYCLSLSYGTIGHKNTVLFIHLFVMFRYVFLCEVQVPAWAAGSYSSCPPAGGIAQILLFKTCE